MISPEMLNRKVFNRELRCEEQLKLVKEPLIGTSNASHTISTDVLFLV